MMFALYDQFVEVRSDKNTWKAALNDIHSWVKKRKAVN